MVSVRQPLVLYATIFLLLFATFVVTITFQSMLNASQRAYRRALRDELELVVQERDLDALTRTLETRRATSDVDVGLVTRTTESLGINLSEAREIASRRDGRDRLVSVRVPIEGVEAYIVAVVHTTVASSIAYAEMGRLIFPVILGALACAALLSFMLRRLLLPPLDALRELARDPTIRASQMVGDEAPNEVLEIANAFRGTVRQLNEEREHLRQQNVELERMQMSLVRASKLASVGRLAAGIAHEIGNPLAAVQGYLALLPRLDEKERNDVVERSAKELLRIHETIKKLLTYARKDEAEEQLGSLPISEVLQDAIVLVRGHAALREVEIKNEIQDASLHAIAHAGRLRQVLVNLLLNAGQAMVDRASKVITLRAGTTAELVEIEVEDTGPGIPPDKLELIFDPFFTTKEPGEGTGLGLAISRALVEGMKGDLMVESKEGQGACFTVRLRRA